MRWTVGTKIALGFGIAVAIFLIVNVVSYRSTTELVSASELRRQTYEMLRHLDRVLSHTKDLDIGSRSYVITGEERFLEPYRAALANTDTALRELRRAAEYNPRLLRSVDVLEPLIKQRQAVAAETIETRRTRDIEAAAQLVRAGRGESLADDIRRTIDEMTAEGEALLAQYVEATDRNARTARWVIGLGTILAFVLAAIAGIVITRNIAGPLGELTAVAERITAGDLSSSVSSDHRTDEVGVLARTFERMTQSLRGMAGVAEQIAAGDLRATIAPQSPKDVLGNAFARMVDNLRDQIRQLVEGASVLGSAATEIVAATAQLAASASESASAVSETTTTVEEVRQTAEVASQKAKYVSDTAQKAAQISENGRQSNEDVVAGMARIRQQMEAIAASMVRLSEQSQAIGLIMATVEDLAAQSNLLAVNAAIEAAKAGEQGKGFAVVAQEVKSLAEQSREATNRVRTILNDIQKATTTAVLATEQGGKVVETGARHTEVAGESIQALAGSVRDAAQAATQIAASSQQQLVGVDQVAVAMESIKQASTQNVASARQLEAAARNLNDLGQQLKEIVGRYTV